jgi:Zn-dependent protease with chaperone function
MKFFEHQDRARQNTQRLVGLYVLSVISIILTIYGAVLVTSSLAGFKSYRYRTYRQSPPIAIAPTESQPNGSVVDPATGIRYYPPSPGSRRYYSSSRSQIAPPNLAPDRYASSWWHPELFWLSVTSAVLVIGGGSWLKLISLKQGGSAIAQQLGGRLLLPETAIIPEEQQLLNVVEEMAIASSMKVPYVYVLDAEPGINAFAAGYTPEDAAIGVTRGCLEQLNRDELQGVIGHEFSHILNGDMRLNIRLIAMLHGILMVYVAGRIVLDWGSSRRGLSRSAMLGLLLMAIGSLGYLWGRIIQSAVSRQREFLADASATQFTRNPEGLAGALHKIQANVYTSQMDSPRAIEMSHMFFGDAVGASWLGDLVATHPPLKQRLRRLESYIGRANRSLRSQASRQPATPASTYSGAIATPIAATVGAPAWLAQIPESLQAAIREPQSAIALVYALSLAAENPTSQAGQLEWLRQEESKAIVDTSVGFAEEITALNPRLHLPLLDLTLPVLRQCSIEERQRLFKCLSGLAEVDEESLLALPVYSILQHHLQSSSDLTEEYATLEPIWNDCLLVFSLVAQTGQKSEEAATYTFRSGLDRLPGAREQKFPDALPAFNFSSLQQSFDRLGKASTKLKMAIANACFSMVVLDDRVTQPEANLLWAIAVTLDRPLPPFLTRHIKSG